MPDLIAVPDLLRVICVMWEPWTMILILRPSVWIALLGITKMRQAARRVWSVVIHISREARDHLRVLVLLLDTLVLVEMMRHTLVKRNVLWDTDVPEDLRMLLHVLKEHIRTPQPKDRVLIVLWECTRMILVRHRVLNVQLESIRMLRESLGVWHVLLERTRVNLVVPRVWTLRQDSMVRWMVKGPLSK